MKRPAGASKIPEGPSMQGRESAGAGSGLVDPVCGMTVDPARAAATIEHGGRTYGFCGPSCARKFREDPARFPGSAPAAPRPAASAPPRPEPAAGPYTCPMHPEIVRAGPGFCPICGMALEPRTASLTEAENPELLDMRRRLWISVAFTVPLFALAMSDILPGRPLHGVLSPV